jgi:hypothetical protein
VVSLSQSDIDAIRTRHIVGVVNPRLRGNIKILTNYQLPLIQDAVYLQYKIPDTEMRILLDVPISNQMDWACPTEAELSYIINVEGV